MEYVIARRYPYADVGLIKGVSAALVDLAEMRKLRKIDGRQYRLEEAAMFIALSCSAREGAQTANNTLKEELLRDGTTQKPSEPMPKKKPTLAQAAANGMSGHPDSAKKFLETFRTE
ncbi:MAG: hypothetical protein ACYCO0_01410 [Candidatus Micrarchaeaceae archaeon]